MNKNISKAEVLVLKDQVAYQEGQVVSKTLAQNDALSVTLFSFDKGEEISTHESGGDAFVTCLDGVGEITINGEKYELHEGESIIMPLILFLFRFCFYMLHFYLRFFRILLCF